VIVSCEAVRQGYFFKKVISNTYEFFLRNTPGRAG